MMICAIDGGAKGAFAFIDGESVIVEPMPQTADGKVDLKELTRLFRHYADQITYCYLEKGGMRPRQSTQSTFAFGRNFGILEGMLACLRINYIVVTPQLWSKEFDHKVTEKNVQKRKRMIKVARRAIVAKLYPGIDLKKTSQCKTPDEGIVDALLIATYGWNKHNKKEMT